MTTTYIVYTMPVGYDVENDIADRLTIEINDHEQEIIEKDFYGFVDSYIQKMVRDMTNGTRVLWSTERLE